MVHLNGHIVDVLLEHLDIGNCLGIRSGKDSWLRLRRLLRLSGELGSLIAGNRLGGVGQRQRSAFGQRFDHRCTSLGFGNGLDDDRFDDLGEIARSEVVIHDAFAS